VDSTWRRRLRPTSEGHAGPQQLDQFFARVGAVRRQRQPRQQGGHGARRETLDELHAVAGRHAAQQTHLPAALTRNRRGHTAAAGGGVGWHSLPPGPARHAQVRRVQPGDTLLLFDGQGADWPATVLAMGKTEVRVRVGAPLAGARELPWPVTLALAMPANERMDTLVEKATELGVAVHPAAAQ
jgi:hypothetical protein